MSMIKYRIHEVAKDFNVTSKVISQILTDYIAPPKNHMQVLETNELDVIFEYMTQHNQAESLEEIFKTLPPRNRPRTARPALPRQSPLHPPARRARRTSSRPPRRPSLPPPRSRQRPSPRPRNRRSPTSPTRPAR